MVDLKEKGVIQKKNGRFKIKRVNLNEKWGV